MATAGVAHHLSDDQIEIALPLQTVAATAWGAAKDAALLPELHSAVNEALAELDDITGAVQARDFLLLVDRYLEVELAAGERATDTGDHEKLTLF